VYSFRTGARVSGAEPEAIADELARIHEANGELTPGVTVEAARKKSSPLHGCFEWDDSAAAHEHRLQQARQLIRAVVVRYETDPADVPARSLYVHVPATGDAGSRYEPLTVVAERPDLAALALAELRAKLAGAERAVDELLRASELANQPERATAARSVKKHLALAAEAVKRAA
jgi:hypothetical protein